MIVNNRTVKIPFMWGNPSIAKVQFWLLANQPCVKCQAPQQKY
jgi:hypothetical protein